MKHLQLYIDLAFCLCIMPLMLFIFPIERWWAVKPLFFALFVLWMYANYFCYKYFIVPKLFCKKRGLAICAIIGSLLITSLISQEEISSPFHELIEENLTMVTYPTWGLRPTDQAIWLYYILVVTFCFAVGSLNEMYKEKMAKEEMELERNKAELSLYHAQINPHFLFNTLNSIYSLMLTSSPKSIPAMEKFIELSKYIFISAKQDYISLGEEVNYIERFIDLQKLRLNEFATVTCDIQIEEEKSRIPPMLLITFVENAFKWGISSCQSCFIDLKLRQAEGKLAFEISK
ncbi:MAG: sensor histidine kinase, partial [Candidatus Cryptobacteroides sp.]